MRSLLLLFVCATSLGQNIDPIPSTAVTNLLSDPAVGGCFAHLMRQGGNGWLSAESAAFIVREGNGYYRCVVWPVSPESRRQHYQGGIPEGTVAIVHTHPRTTPKPSLDDCQTARRLSTPIFVLTLTNVYLVTSRGEVVALIKDRFWAA